jgi:hypothetical protein
VLRQCLYTWQTITATQCAAAFEKFIPREEQSAENNIATSKNSLDALKNVERVDRQVGSGRFSSLHLEILEFPNRGEVTVVVPLKAADLAVPVSNSVPGGCACLK